MNTRLIALTSGALLTAAALVGCTAGSPGSDSGMGNMPGMDHSSASTDTATSDHNQADVTFAMAMVPHHQQAIEMSDTLLTKQGVDARVTDLAQKIKAAQQPEIDTMNGWLSAWGQKSDMSGMDMGGDGMMSQQDMNALTKASGADASKLFLTQMIQHHQGAITMATTETEKGKATDAVALAKTIAATQTAEIATMKQLLASL
ncbi:DUF305 domain-containing protein [Leifsonia soli]|jgi:uncharacterized protein (DUF305 family)|uniref:Uncharacterized protein (DUF305 family) n=1 Tax=Leifsonia soli TaxID=582665 RepID=A0A852T290_9MICO|nr:DUF305 domain-containing protein [Leifsonia soli]NYD74942.1 uncharacterized protein (DUF305 family) [Leifsonia soli]